MDSKRTLDLENLSPEDRKARVTELLNEFASRSDAIGEPGPTASEHKNRYLMSMGMIFYATVFSSLMLLASSVYFHFIPAPLAYITTQDGRIIELTPIKK
ncbi:hypothetical protein IFT48_04365 [Pseudomonas fluorescens]|uniref:hypothetical protein n=1 Tax=Pseudomonas TaxID=286 RepID=UPI000F02DE7D|nr:MULTISPECIES: hypothetical protein [Pseudomonas]MBD8089206.1 hypothetical protein [Pseudomonas fluorescens]MBD8615367.1 hypothetical protein [Pseudomonas putida]MBD8681979.1 hypothetical protein [Pseudomonas sp. CFBP 13719]